MIKFSMTRDVNGYNGFGLSFSDNKTGGLLSSGSPQSIAVPFSPYADFPNILAVFSFSPGSSVWVALNEAVVLPSGSIAAVNCEQNPAGRYLKLNYDNTGSSIQNILYFDTNDALDEFGVTFYATA